MLPRSTGEPSTRCVPAAVDGAVGALLLETKEPGHLRKGVAGILPTGVPVVHNSLRHLGLVVELIEYCAC